MKREKRKLNETQSEAIKQTRVYMTFLHDGSPDLIKVSRIQSKVTKNVMICLLRG